MVDYIHTTSLRVVSIYISRSDYTYTSSHIYLMHPPAKVVGFKLSCKAKKKTKQKISINDKQKLIFYRYFGLYFLCVYPIYEFSSFAILV